MQKGSVSILNSISYQTLSVSPANNDMVDLWHNLWCNNSRVIFFLYGNFFVFEISLVFPKNACFLCALCGNVPALFSFAHEYTVQNPLWNKQVCPKFINAMIELTRCIYLVQKVLCVTLRSKDLRYRHKLLFVLVLFVLLLRDALPQLQCGYPYVIMNLEWNMKFLVSCGTLLQNLKSNLSIANCHQNVH